MVRRAASIALFTACVAASPAVGAPGTGGRLEITEALTLLAERSLDPVDREILVSSCMDGMRKGGDVPTGAGVASPVAVFDALLASGGDKRALIRACIEGMAAAAGDPGAYLDVQDHRRTAAEPGLKLEIEGDGPRIVAIGRGKPAESGLRTNDRITAIDGRPTRGMTLDQVNTLLRGEDGSQVSLAVARADAPPFDLRLTRSIGLGWAFPIETRMRDGIGIIRIAQFGSDTEKQVRSGLKSLRKTVVKGYVVDLRGNGGGLLETIVSTTDLFVDRGEIVTNRGRSAADLERWYARPGDMTDGQPLIVLVDAGTGSGALILAEALRVNRKARLIGHRTAGGGDIKTLIPLSDDVVLRLTTSRMVLASGVAAASTGIAPDIEIPDEDETDTARDALARAIALLSAAHQAAGAE